MIKLIVLLQLLIAPFCWSAVAEQPDRVSSEMVRQRMYSGGRDEEDLNVQTGTAPIVRKLDAKAIQSQILKGIKTDSESATPAAEESNEF